MVAMHWQHRLNHMVKRYNDIYRVQTPNITPHVCRHTYCSNMAKSGMNPKTLQYIMGHSDIAVTLNVYTHIGLDDATEELRKLEEMEIVRAVVVEINFKYDDLKIDICKTYEYDSDVEDLRLHPSEYSVQEAILSMFQKRAYEKYSEILERQKKEALETKLS